MYIAAVHGVKDGVLGRRMGVDEGIAGRVIVSGSPAVLDDYQDYPERVSADFIGKAIHATASAPITWGGEVRGAITVATRDPERRFAGEVELLRDLAEVAGTALEHATMRRRLEEGLTAGVEALSSLLDLRDGYTAQHSGLVGELACELGRRLRRPRAGPLRAVHRRPAARPREDRRARSHPAQAGPAGSRRVDDHAAPPRVGRRHARADPGPGCGGRRTSATTTSAGTARAIPRASRRTGSRWRAGSSPSATPTGRCSPTGPTAADCPAPRRWPSSRRGREPSSIPTSWMRSSPRSPTAQLPALGRHAAARRRRRGRPSAQRGGGHAAGGPITPSRRPSAAWRRCPRSPSPATGCSPRSPSPRSPRPTSPPPWSRTSR